MCHQLSFLIIKTQVAVVVVGFPATPLLLARARICISASHSREDLVRALEVGVFFFFCLIFWDSFHLILISPQANRIKI